MCMILVSGLLRLNDGALGWSADSGGQKEAHLVYNGDVPSAFHHFPEE